MISTPPKRLAFTFALMLLVASGVAAADVAETQSSATMDLTAIQRRLEQQEAEIRQLREQLGMLHEEVRLLPPVQPASVVEPLPVPHRANVYARPSAPDGVREFEMQERLDHLERRVEELSTSDLSTGKLGPSAEGYEVGSDLEMTASWKNGLELSTKNRDFRVHVGGRTQLDLSGFDNDPALTVPRDIGGIGPQPNSIQLRRARLRVDGTMYEVFDWAAEYDFANALANALPQTTGQPVALTPALTELWLTWRELPRLGNIRVGNVKEPIGMEHLESSRWLDFIERSFLQDAVFGPYNNGFNPGAYTFDWSVDERSTWALGMFANNSDPFGYGIGDDWAITGRITRLLYYDEPAEGRYLFHVGASASLRKPDEDEVRIRTRGNIRSGPPSVLNPIYGDTGTMQADFHELVSLEAASVWGPWSMQAEYTGTWVSNAYQPYTPAEDAVFRGSPFFHGGYIQLMYFLTGEHRDYNRRLGVFDRVVPLTNAYFVDTEGGRCFGRGAWQVGARYSAIDLNEEGINGGVLHAGTFGVNWFLNPNSKIQFNYDLTHRSQVQGVPPGVIHAFGVRFAHDF